MNRFFTLLVKFRPGGASAFFSFPIQDLTDQSISLKALWKDEADLLSDQLTHFADHNEIKNCFEAINRVLLNHCPEPDQTTPIVAAAMHCIRNSSGTTAVHRLADELGYSERHLRKIFNQYVGLSPKRLMRIMRVTHTVRRIDAGWPYSQAQLADAGGYYDQAHMIDDFQALLGESPVPFIQRENRECVLPCCSVFSNTSARPLFTMKPN
jgi:AraC-like DNA-binding protein